MALGSASLAVANIYQLTMRTWHATMQWML